jgi:hypothetical protein
MFHIDCFAKGNNHSETADGLVFGTILKLHALIHYSRDTRDGTLPFLAPPPPFGLTSQSTYCGLRKSL